MAYKSTNPYTAQVLQHFDQIDDAALDGRLQAAQACFSNHWRNTSFQQRQAVLGRAAPRR